MQPFPKSWGRFGGLLLGLKISESGFERKFVSSWYRKDAYMNKSARRTFLKYSALATSGFASRGVFTAFAESADIFKSASSPLIFAQAKNGPEVIAHRGGNGQWPGETLYAMRQARDLKVDALEMDVYLTKDGQLALMHDIRIQKTTNGKGLIHKFTLAQLQQLSAAYAWPANGSSEYFHKTLEQLPESRRNDLRVPSLQEVFKQFPEMRMVIEMKPAPLSPAAPLYKLIRDNGMTDNVLVASFWGGFMKEFRALCEKDKVKIATSITISVEDLSKFAADVVQAPFQIIKPDFVAKVRTRNLKLHAWTVNEIADMERMINLGVDGIITDYPGPLLSLLHRIQPVSG
jgi:glycerophosphoryl diester phosphodiesterase